MKISTGEASGGGSGEPSGVLRSSSRLDPHIMLDNFTRKEIETPKKATIGLY
jgi:hypothetical protein